MFLIFDRIYLAPKLLQLVKTSYNKKYLIACASFRSQRRSENFYSDRIIYEVIYANYI